MKLSKYLKFLFYVQFLYTYVVWKGSLDPSVDAQPP